MRSKVQPLKGATRFLKISFWILFVGFVLYLLSSSPGEQSAWNPAWRFVVEITAPFQNVTHDIVETVEGFWLNYFRLVNARQENIQLKTTVDTLKMENSRYRELLSTHEKLTALLQFKQTANRKALAAQVIGLDPTGWFKSVMINKGKDDGLELDMPVVNADGVVGKIVSLSPNYAKVLLIIDQNSGVDCLVQRSRDRGVVKGISSEVCEMKYVVKSSDIAVGDTVVTSGLGGVYSKGIPVGEVLSVTSLSGKLFKDVKIRPAVDFSKLEEVLILLTPGIKEDELSIPQKEEN